MPEVYFIQSKQVEIRILGTRGEVPEKKKHYKSHSGVLIDNRILVDWGEQDFSDYHPELILITHLHPDHAFFVRNSGLEKVPVPVYAPEKVKQIQSFEIIKTKLEWDGYQITPVPVIHSIKVKSQGYIIEKGDKKIFYSGDMIWIPKKHHFLLENLNLVITEASYFRKGGMIRKDAKSGRIFGHAGVRELIGFFGKFTNKIVFLHYGSWFLKNIPSGKRKISTLQTNSLELIAARDELLIEI